MEWDVFMCNKCKVLTDSTTEECSSCGSRDVSIIRVKRIHRKEIAVEKDDLGQMVNPYG